MAYVLDTIAAIATAPGMGAIGIVRVSGPDALLIAQRVFSKPEPANWESHRLYHGRIQDPGGRFVDDAMAVLMRAPHSYTGEDVLELHCHGSPVLLRVVLQHVLAAGARAAEAGEFTRRAFLNGKLDLAQAEAVIDLICARTQDSAAMAASQILGGLSRHLNELRDRLLRVRAYLEVEIDFSEEDVAVDENESMALLGAVVDDMRRLIDSYERGRLFREGMRVAIAGRPNVGKSSLLNALLGEERAIVTPIAGTTRDVIEESANFHGVPVVLCDTAGLRDAPDQVEQIGVERARATVRAADVALLVFDASRPPVCLEEAFDVDRTVAVLNKIDLPLAWSESAIDGLRERYGAVVRVSARERVGLDDLKQVVLDRVAPVDVDGLPVITRVRQRDALGKARECLEHALTGFARGTPADLIAADVQSALDHMAAVTARVASEDVLDVIFSEFCVGK